MLTIPRIKIIIFSMSVLVLGFLYYFFNPVGHSFFPECPFYTLTGLYCPGCGSQRAFYELLHGHLLKAVHENLLFVLAVPFVIYSAVVYCGINLFGKPWKQVTYYTPQVAKIALGFVLIFWVLRNLPFSFFHWMAP